MKKMILGLGLGIAVLGLTACAEIPDNVDERFHAKAWQIFMEIDDDTMEMEYSDIDDVSNIELLGVSAESKREKDFILHLTEMAKQQVKIVEEDKTALKKYMTAREKAMKTMNLGDNNETDEFEVYEFEFTED